MIKTITIGTMVLCHLYSGTPNSNNASPEENKKIIKVLGEVIEISKAPMYLEKVDKKEALEAEKDMLIVKAKNNNGIYQISARACMVVRKETPEETQSRKIIKKEIKKSNPASSIETQDGPTYGEGTPPPAEEVPPEPVILETKPVPNEKEEVKELPPEPKIDLKKENSKTPDESKKGILDYIVN